MNADAHKQEMSDEEVVRLVMEEAGTDSASVVNQVLYLLQTANGARPRFRFLFQPFVGVRDARVDGLVQSARVNLVLGRNGMPRVESSHLRERVRALIADLPEGEDNLRLVASAAYGQRHHWGGNGAAGLVDAVERSRGRVAPSADLSSEAACGIASRIVDDGGRPAVAPIDSPAEQAQATEAVTRDLEP